MEKNYADLIKILDPVLLDSLVERKGLLTKEVNEIMVDTVSKHENYLQTCDKDQLRSSREALVAEIDSWLTEAEEKLRTGYDLESVTTSLQEIADKMKELRNVSTDLSVLDKSYYNVDEELEKLEGKFECVRIGVEVIFKSLLFCKL